MVDDSLRLGHAIACPSVAHGSKTAFRKQQQLLGYQTQTVFLATDLAPQVPAESWVTSDRRYHAQPIAWLS